MADVTYNRIRAAMAEQPWQRTGHLSLRGVAHGEIQLAPTAELATLRSLDLSGNRLTAPPSWLAALPALEELDLSGNRIAALPGLAGLGGLRALDLSENRISVLPGGWQACTRLAWLSLASNQLAELAPLSGIPGLEILDVARNRLRSLSGLPGAATLRALDASGNELADLPAAIAAFRALRRLDLSRNQLTSRSLAPLAGLPIAELFLDYNRIDLLPGSLTHRTFRCLSVAGNPLQETEYAAVSAAARDDSIRAFIEQHVSGGYLAGELYFDAPAYNFDFRIGVEGVRGASELVDLYYKGYAGMPVNVRLGDGTTAALNGLTRRSALELVARHQGATDRADVEVVPGNQRGARDAGVAFTVEAMTKLADADLVADDSSRLALDRPAAPRVVNVMLADPDGGVLPVTTVLTPATAYLVRVSLGPEAPQTLVLNPVPLPLDELEPDTGGGWWFDVVVASADVDVAATAHRMYVPARGAGWVCPCQGTEHTCTPAQRRRYLDVPFRTGDGTSGSGAASLRCTVYHRNNAVQSIRVAFSTGTGDGPPDVLIHGVVDYSLADDLALAQTLPARQFSVLTNETAGGTHTIVVKGEGGRAVAVNLTETAVQEVLRAVREQLTLITLGRDAQTTQYDDDNAATAGQLTADLETMAYLGSAFWEKAVPAGADQAVLRPLLAAGATIQVARVTSTVFPWAIVYDYPHLLGDPWEPCELLRRWPQAKAALVAPSPGQDGCPYAAGHRLNTLCPFGFWGFRHRIEQPPSVLQGRLCTTLIVPDGAHAATVRSLNLDGDVSATHLERLRDCLAPRFALTDCDSRDDFVAAIDGPALPLIYFYCHGRMAKLGDRGVDLHVPYLEIGHDEMLGTGDLNAWAAAGQWHPERWQDVPPLVFINGCKTAALSPEQIVTFVDAFAGAEAAGIIGTEIAVAQPVASEFAYRFYQHLMAGPGANVGQALHQAKLDLLAKGNIAGLVYTAFCSMDLELEGEAR